MRRRIVVAIVVVPLSGLGACLVDVDASLLDASKDATVADAPNDAPYLGMPCGKATCTPPAQACCTGGFGNPNRSDGTCGRAEECASGDYWDCMSARDCAEANRPAVCCARSYPNNGGFANATCVASACDGVVLCEGDGGACPNGLKCSRSATLIDLYECR